MKSTSSQILDEEALSQLKQRSIRGRSMLEQMRIVFQQEAPELRDGIGYSIEAGNLEGLYQYAHKLKGICAVMGARRVWNLCNALIEAHDAGQLPEPSRLAELSEALEEYLRAVQDYEEA
ncbi:MAG: Hpt domain-containing protein [Opitutales bacterium]